MIHIIKSLLFCIFCYAHKEVRLLYNMYKKNTDYVFGKNNCIFRANLQNDLLINGAPMANVVPRDHVTIGAIEHVAATGNKNCVETTVNINCYQTTFYIS